MVVVDALKSVNTRTFPELQNVVNGKSPIFDPDGGFSALSADEAHAVYPNAATLEIIFSSEAGDFAFVGIGIDAEAQGTVSSLEARTGSGLIYQLTDFTPFTLNQLYADASTGLKTFPASLLGDADTLNGSAFNDVLFAFDGTDSVNGNGGDDQLNGGDGNDGLDGGDGNDSMDGGADSDDLDGGLGADRLTGGAGKDYFAYSLGDSTKKASGRDTITDFSHAQGDLIELDSIDARKGGADNDFRFIGDDHFHERKGDLRYKYLKKDGDALVQADINGDGKADFAILVENVSKLKAIDFDL